MFKGSVASPTSYQSNCVKPVILSPPLEQNVSRFSHELFLHLEDHILRSIFLCAPQDQEGKPKRANVHDNKDGTYAVTYIPDKTGRYMIGVTYGGDDIPLSPYRIRATQTGDASKCLATGECRPGIGKPGPIPSLPRKSCVIKARCSTTLSFGQT